MQSPALYLWGQPEADYLCREWPAEAFTVEGEPDPGAENQPERNTPLLAQITSRRWAYRLLKGENLPIAIHRRAGCRGHQRINGTPLLAKEISVGQRFKIGLFNSDSPWLTIVGVAQDVRSRGLDNQIPVEFFRPFPQAAWPTMTIAVRTVSNPYSYLVPIKKAIAETNPEVPVSDVQSLDELVSESVGQRRFSMLLLSTFGALGLVLAAVGIYGVVAYGVTQRTQEIGIRMALGAQQGQVLRLMVGSIIGWTIAGVVIGILGAFAATRLIADLLYGISATDPYVLERSVSTAVRRIAAGELYSSTARDACGSNDRAAIRIATRELARTARCVCVG